MLQHYWLVYIGALGIMGSCASVQSETYWPPTKYLKNVSYAQLLIALCDTQQQTVLNKAIRFHIELLELIN